MMFSFGFLTYSIKKSFKLKKLQREIAPATFSSMDDAYHSFMDNEKSKKQDAALESYLDMCEADPAVKHIMALYSLSRTDLKNIYHSLVRSGCGGWYKGHYAALSSIAYFEPLMFYMKAKQSNKPDLEIAVQLIDYWQKDKPLLVKDY